MEKVYCWDFDKDYNVLILEYDTGMVVATISVPRDSINLPINQINLAIKCIKELNGGKLDAMDVALWLEKKNNHD